jgi:hypothetical protein
MHGAVPPAASCRHSPSRTAALQSAAMAAGGTPGEAPTGLGQHHHHPPPPVCATVFFTSQIFLVATFLFAMKNARVTKQRQTAQAVCDAQLSRTAFGRKTTKPGWYERHTIPQQGFRPKDPSGVYPEEIGVCSGSVRCDQPPFATLVALSRDPPHLSPLDTTPPPTSAHVTMPTHSISSGADAAHMDYQSKLWIT